MKSSARLDWLARYADGHEIRVDVGAEGPLGTTRFLRAHGAIWEGGQALLESMRANPDDLREKAVFRNAFGHVVLPSAVLGYFSIAYIARMTRSFMLEQLNQEYVVTARAKGVSEARIIWVHALRNIAVQLVTVIALSYARLLEGAVLTETVFAWPGLGRYLTTALLAGDMNAVLGATIVVGLVFVGINLLSDLLYRLLDPRSK
jgi:peptide/nickel transport system permease protein